ncbi:MAG: nitrile hydratase accessory protein [Gammaproteobacteria bacterium]|nr:nitrile hydratase accessory protein [Gammaproteobacteria bacterium]MDH3468417.1 nitrile hydratase accessory protein [Gammaproteobacteria bacterium]
MNAPDLSLLPDMRRDDAGPVFAEPWQAQAFALAVRLSENGHFTWPEWADYLAHEIAAARRAGTLDLGDTYYEHWLRALERIVTDKQILTTRALEERKRCWDEAARHTEHGKPIELADNQ